jgi:hypothetical protein
MSCGKKWQHHGGCCQKKDTKPNAPFMVNKIKLLLSKIEMNQFLWM